MLQEYIQAMLMILIAEMGDKTQILALTFATKYKLRQIVIGVLIGSFLNHGIAIILGSLLTKVLPIDALQLVAGLMFVGFAFWSLKVEDEEVDGEGASYGPIITVALAFFLGELGDKTQLTALTLGASAQYPFLILLGTVTGMALTSMIGIWVGSKLGKKIPEMQLKLGAFAVFMFFGLEKLARSPYTQPLGVTGLIIGIGVIILFGLWQAKRFVQLMTQISGETALAHKAESLRTYLHKTRQEVENLCHGEAVCNVCKGGGCTVGFMKELLDRSAIGEETKPFEVHKINALLEKEFNPVLTKSILMSLKDYYDSYPDEYVDNLMLKSLRSALERILFGEVLEECKDFETYRSRLVALDDTFGLKQF